MTRTFGIDVSHWQGSIDFRQAVDNGVRFAFVKCCQNGQIDKNFQTNWKAAKASGLMRGAYCFGDYNQPAVAQAQAFTKFLHTDKGELPPVLDIEKMVIQQYNTETKKYEYVTIPLPARTALLGWIEQFMIEIYQSMGVRAILYTNPATIKHLSPIPTDLLAHDLWLTHYLYPASVAAGWQPISSRGAGTHFGSTPTGLMVSNMVLQASRLTAIISMATMPAY